MLCYATRTVVQQDVVFADTEELSIQIEHACTRTARTNINPYHTLLHTKITMRCLMRLFLLPILTHKQPTV